MNINKISLSEARKRTTEFMGANIPCLLHGSPGLGKSAILHAIAKDNDLYVVDMRLAQIDPTDLKGFVTPINSKTNGGKVDVLPIEDFILATDEVPVNPKTGKPHKGVLLFLDEIGNAPLSVQSAAYRLVLDRKVGKHDLHPSTRIVAATNYVSDNAAACRMSTALTSRFANLYVETQVDEFREYARISKMDHRVIGYLNFRPENLFRFDAKAVGETFSAPRTWQMASDYLKTLSNINGSDTLDMNHRAGVIGCIGSTVGNEFFTFCQVYEELPAFEDILNDPENAPLPSDQMKQHAIVTFLSNKINKANLDVVVRYVERLAPEFQYLVVKDIVVRAPDLVFHQWVQKHTKHLTKYMD